ncbi:MAG: VWA domain-containing protein [Gammaproteobacteria bacterium]|nr:VWA domain-containing protein [Gammaproteobacteria bacterium]
MRILGRLFLVGLLAGLLGMAAPASAATERDVILVLDNSGSMKLNDPARLSVSAVTDFIRAQSPGTRVGIVMFADSPSLLQPLTPVSFETRDQLLGSLDALDFSGQWTDTASAVERALYELRLNGREGSRKAIVLITDGIIDTGAAQRDIEKGSWLREMLAEDARRNNVRIFGIAFTENADYQLLQSLAGATDGEYFRALRAQDLGSVLERIDRVLDRSQVSQRFAEQAAAQDTQRDFATPTEPPARSGVAESTSEPADVEPEVPAERIRMDAEDSSPTQDAGAMSEAAQGAAEEGGFERWRIVLIILGLLAVGAVAASILWSDEIAKLLRGVRRPAKEPDHGPSAVLYDVYDPSDIKRHEIGAKPVVIGRVSGSDPAMDYIVVDERTVGRWHATVERRGQSFWIRDEGSVNGTYVNDQRVTSEHPLKHGDMVRVHRHEFEFVIPELFDSDRTMIAAGGSKTNETGGAMSTG